MKNVKHINEAQLKAIVSESVKKSLSEIRYSTYRNAYDKMGQYGQRERQDQLRGNSQKTVFQNNSYIITTDFETLDVTDINDNNHIYTYSYENDDWNVRVSGVSTPPRLSPNNKEWQEAVNALCNQISSIRNEEGLGQSQWANPQSYYDTQYDARMQQDQAKDEFYGYYGGENSPRDRVLYQGQTIKVVQEANNGNMPGLIVYVNGYAYGYDYEKDDWTGRGMGYYDGSQSYPPQLGYGPEAQAAARAIISIIGKYRQMNGLQPSKWQNKNYYFNTGSAAAMENNINQQPAQPMMNEAKLNRIVSESVKKVLNESTCDDAVIEKWNYLEKKIGAEIMLDYIFSWCPPGQLQQFVNDLEREAQFL